MDISFRELNGLLERQAKEKLAPLGFTKRQHYWVKEEGDFILKILYATYESYPGKDISFLFIFNNFRFGILSMFLDFSLNNASGNFHFDKFDSSVFIYSQHVLYYENLLPRHYYHVSSLTEAEKTINHIYNHYFQMFVPLTERSKDVDVLEWELNEGIAWKWQNLVPGSINPIVCSRRLTYAKLVSEERYLLIKKKFNSLLKNLEHDIPSSGIEIWQEEMNFWQKTITYLDNTSTEALNELTDELLLKYNAPTKAPKKIKSSSKSDKTKRKTKYVNDENMIIGFDSDGEPELRRDEDGSLRIVFNFMPPLNGDEEGNDHPIFERFDEVLSRALGVEVLWEDREVFLISQPTADTAQKAKAFLESFWDQLPTLEQEDTPPPPTTPASDPPQEKKRKWWPFG